MSGQAPDCVHASPSDAGQNAVACGLGLFGGFPHRAVCAACSYRRERTPEDAPPVVASTPAGLPAIIYVIDPEGWLVPAWRRMNSECQVVRCFNRGEAERRLQDTGGWLVDRCVIPFVGLAGARIMRPAGRDAVLALGADGKAMPAIAGCVKGCRIVDAGTQPEKVHWITPRQYLLVGPGDNGKLALARRALAGESIAAGDLQIYTGCGSCAPFAAVIVDDEMLQQAAKSSPWQSSEPVVSVVIVARNEGDEVRLTADDVIAHGADEVIVVDDASTDGSCLSLPERVQVIRNAEPVGIAGSRNLGGSMARGRVIVFMDGHMRVSAGNLQDFAEKAERFNAIMCSGSMPLHADRDWTSYGGHFSSRAHGDCYDVVWNRGKPRGQYPRIGCLVGACYAIPRTIYRALGGWPPLTLYGYNEQALSMAAWFMGVPLRIDHETMTRHLYRKRNPTPGAGESRAVNWCLAHWLMFDDATWREVWEPANRRLYPKIMRRFGELIATGRFDEHRKRYQARKVIGDAEFMAQATRYKQSNWGER